MSTTYHDEPGYEPWGYNEDEGATLTMDDIHDIAMAHAAAGDELIHSHVAVSDDRLKEWAGTIETALWGAKTLAAERGEWVAVVCINGSKGYWIVNATAMSRILPDTVQIIAEKDGY